MAGGKLDRPLVNQDRLVDAALIIQPVGEVEVKACIIGSERNRLTAGAFCLLEQAHLTESDAGEIKGVGMIRGNPKDFLQRQECICSLLVPTTAVALR